MARVARTRKLAKVKRVISQRDDRLKKPSKPPSKSKAATSTHIPRAPSNLFFTANTALTPPCQIILDSNFFAHTLRAKIDIWTGLMDLLYARCTPKVPDCVVAELEKLGPKYRLAMQLAKDEQWQRLPCDHPVYADDCIVKRVTQHRIYLVGTNDRELKRRLRKILGVPLISVGRGRYSVERLPEW